MIRPGVGQEVQLETRQERLMLHDRMRHLQGVAVIAFAIFGACAVVGPAAAETVPEEGKAAEAGKRAPSGAVPVAISGGVSLEERSALEARREAYNLWVITAARKSGAYMAQVRVKVSDAQQRVVFDGELQGPWLFIDLPLGRYLIEARLGDQVQHRSSTIHPGDHHQAVFYFDVDADVVPVGAKDGPTARRPADPATGSAPR